MILGVMFLNGAFRIWRLDIRREWNMCGCSKWSVFHSCISGNRFRENMERFDTSDIGLLKKKYEKERGGTREIMSLMKLLPWRERESYGI